MGRRRRKSARGGSLYRRVLRMEPLEERRLLSITVNTLVDENDGIGVGGISLRDAIAAANAAPGAETIDFDPALTADGPATILLTHGELKITDDLTISGPGADLLTVDAQQQSRIFNITAATGDETLSGLTVTGGLNQEIGFTSGGGAVRSLTAGLLTIDSCTIYGNTTVAGSTAGGGIFAEGPLSLIQSTVSGNQSGRQGGGVYSARYVTATGSTISDNSISRSYAGGLGFSPYSGGGIYSKTSVMVTDCMVTGNSVHGSYFKSFGGGINAQNSLTIDHCTITGNHAGVGGGVFNPGPVVIKSSTISGNTGYNGAGVYGIDVSVYDSSIDNNTADGSAFALSSTFRGVGGGGIDAAHSATIVRSSVIGNKVTPFELRADGGGGILSSGTIRLEESMVSGNTVSGSFSEGGGAYCHGTLTMLNSTVAGNRVDTYGGGIAAVDAGVQITNSTISGNYAGAFGGGVWIRGHGDNTGVDSSIDDSTFAGNIAATFDGDVFVRVGTLNLNQTIASSVRGFLGANIVAHFSLITNNFGSGLAEAPVGAPDANGNLIGGPVHGSIYPSLGPLVYNGGPTFLDGSRLLTHALLPGRPIFPPRSPAIDAGDPTAGAGANGVPEFDERGAPFTRVFGGRIDIGAIEFQPNPLAGDYNFDGIVDAADYTVWRDTFHTFDIRADGDGNDIVEPADYDVWRNNFGATLPIGGASSTLRSESAALVTANLGPESGSAATTVRALSASPAQQPLAVLFTADIVKATRPVLPSSGMASDFKAREAGLLLWLNDRLSGQPATGAKSWQPVWRRSSAATSDEHCTRSSDVTDQFFDSLAFAATVE